MSVYTRKLRRELLGQKGLAVAVLAVTSLGVFLFITSAAGYLDLKSSYADTRTRLALADLHIDVPSLSEAQLGAVQHLPGVAAAGARVVTALPVGLPSDASARVELRLLSLPVAAQPRLDQVLVLSGRLPAADGEVLLEKHLAEHHHLSAGDTVTVRTPGFTRPLTVCGVAVSAEYLWVTRDDQDVFPSPATFGVGWMTRPALQHLAQAVLAEAPASAPHLGVAASDAAGNQLLVHAQPSVALPALMGEVRQLLGPDQVLSEVKADDLAGVRLLQMDVDGYKGMAAFFPFFFLGVGAFIVATVLGRLVDAQRPVIGTLLALGVGRGTVLRHYLAFSAVQGGLGAVGGAALGLVSGRAVTQQYALELGIPFVTAHLHWDLALWGVVGALGVSLLSGALPAWRASRLAPAESMRPPRPSLGWLARLARRLPAPLVVRMGVRDLLGAPVRSLGTVFGIAAALVLVIVSGVMLDSMKTVVRVLFEEAQRYQLKVQLVTPTPLIEVTERLGRLDGVTRAEGVVELPVMLSAHGQQQPALLQGLGADDTLVRSLDADGTPVRPAQGGVVLTRHLARALGIQVGDAVQLKLLPEGGTAAFTLSGLADAAMGPLASARREDVQAAFGLASTVSTATLAVRKEALEGVRRALAGTPTVARVEDLAAMRDQVGQVMGLGWVMLGTMLFFSVVLAAAILFNTATLNILERRRELATLRSLGHSQAELAFGLTFEHSLLTLGGLAVGLPLSIAAAASVLSLYSGDLFVLPFVLSPQTLGAAVLGVVLTLLLAQWPALRASARLPLAEAVRARD